MDASQFDASQAADATVAGPFDGPAFTLHHARGTGPFVLLCEHASWVRNRHEFSEISNGGIGRKL